MNTDKLFDNLVPYTHESVAWTDWHSPVAIHWREQDAVPGLHVLQCMFGFAGTLLTERLLTWELREKGNVLSPGKPHRTFRPDQYLEKTEYPGCRVDFSAAWPLRNGIISTFKICNTTHQQQQLGIVFNYPGKGVEPVWDGVYPAGKIVPLSDEPEGSWSTLFYHREHGRNISWVYQYVAGMTEGTTLEWVCLSDLSPRTFTIEPEGSHTFQMAMAFGHNRGSAREVLRQMSTLIEDGWTPKRETRRWRKRVTTKTPLSPKFSGQLLYERLDAHAISGLHRLCIRGDGGHTGHSRVVWTTTAALAISFCWDTAFSCLGIAEFDPVMAAESIECHVNNVSPRGGLPGTVCDTHRAGEGQVPVMATAAWKVFQRGGDRDWLGRVYPTLGGYSRFWRKYQASSRGFFRLVNGGQVADNDARWDRIQGGKDIYNMPLSGLESPDVNAFFVMEMRVLARMAQALGRDEDAKQWTAQADTLAKQIVDCFYFPEHAMFFDVVEGTREILSGVKGPNMFLPLLAGVPLPPEEIRRVIEGHMLNPKEFFGEVPFPSLSYDDHRYDPMGYWRGRTWPHIAYMMVQVLWKHGYEKEAEIAADRLLRKLQRPPWIWENYESRDGKGVGYPEYNWSLAVVIRLLRETYKEQENSPPLPNDVLTPKENLLRVIRHDRPQWVPNGMEDTLFFCPKYVTRPAGAGYDSWGVRWELEEGPHCGTFPAPDGAVVTDLRQWRDQIRFPDIDAMDWRSATWGWGGCSPEMRPSEQDRERYLMCGVVELGLFERSYLLLGMEQALMAYVAEPEDMEHLVTALADFYVRLIERFDDAFDLDMIWYGDDWGTQQNLFMPPDTWRAIIKPHTKRIYDTIKGRGIILNQHSCGRIESVFDDVVEMGADIWNPCQPCNDLARLKQRHRERITFCGGIDSQFVLDRPSVTLEEVRAEVRRRIDELADGGGYIAGPSHGVPYRPDIMETMNDEINRYGRAFYGNPRGRASAGSKPSDPCRP